MAHHSGIDELALSGQTTKSQILSKALALFDVVSQGGSEKKRVGILDQNKQLLTEIVGI